MELKKFFLEQLEAEAASSRKAIERVPEGQNSFKPHDRSMELGYLASLVATMPGWVAMMIENDETDLNAGGATFRTRSVATRAELLAMLDEGLAKSRAALENTTEDVIDQIGVTPGIIPILVSLQELFSTVDDFIKRFFRRFATQQRCHEIDVRDSKASTCA